MTDYKPPYVDKLYDWLSSGPQAPAMPGDQFKISIRALFDRVKKLQKERDTERGRAMSAELTLEKGAGRLLSGRYDDWKQHAQAEGLTVVDYITWLEHWTNAGLEARRKKFKDIPELE